MPAGVLAVRAGLAPVGRAPAHVPSGQRVGRQDLLGVVRRQRHLGRADQVQVVVGQVVDVLGRLAQEPGALHRRRPHQRRRDDRRQPVGHRGADRQVEQGQLQLGTLSGEEVEPRARDLGAALDVDRAEDLTQLEVVARSEPLGSEVPPAAALLEHDVVVLAARRNAVDDHVRDGLEQCLEGFTGVPLGGLGLLDLVGELLRPGQQLGLLLRRRLRDLLAQVLLLGPQPLVRGDGRPAPGVGRQGLVDDRLRLTAGALRRLDPVGVGAQHLHIDHVREPTEVPE